MNRKENERMPKSKTFVVALFCALAVSLEAQSNAPVNPGTNGSELPIPSPKVLNGKTGIEGGDGIPALLTSVRQQERDIKRHLDEIDVSSNQQAVADAKRRLNDMDTDVIIRTAQLAAAIQTRQEGFAAYSRALEGLANARTVSQEVRRNTENELDKTRNTIRQLEALVVELERVHAAERSVEGLRQASDAGAQLLEAAHPALDSKPGTGQPNTGELGVKPERRN
jgi:hypothetical protein